MSVEDRRKVVSLIKDFEAAAPEGSFAWTKENVVRLLPFVALEDVHCLRACYLTSLKDSSVVEGKQQLVAVDCRGETEDGMEVDAPIADDDVEADDDDVKMLASIAEESEANDVVESLRRKAKQDILNSFTLVPQDLVTDGYKADKYA